MPLPQRKKRGDSVSWEDFNNLLDIVTKLSNLTVTAPLSLTSTGYGKQIGITKDDDGWWGIIKTTGPQGSEDDYTDNRYWVSRAFCVGSANGASDTVKNSKATDNINWHEYPSSSNFHLVVTAYSSGEQVSKSHSLAAGTPVFVRNNWDVGTPSNNRYIFATGGDDIGHGSLYQVYMTTDAIGTRSWMWPRFH